LIRHRRFISLSPFWRGSGPNQTAFIITDLTERPSDLSQYRLIGRWRAFLYLIRNSFFVPQVEQAFWFAGFHRFDYSLSTGAGEFISCFE
jgi:hypothetical protein